MTSTWRSRSIRRVATRPRKPRLIFARATHTHATATRRSGLDRAGNSQSTDRIYCNIKDTRWQPSAASVLSIVILPVSPGIALSSTLGEKCAVYLCITLYPYKRNNYYKSWSRRTISPINSIVISVMITLSHVAYTISALKRPKHIAEVDYNFQLNRSLSSLSVATFNRRYICAIFHISLSLSLSS